MLRIDAAKKLASDFLTKKLQAHCSQVEVVGQIALNKSSVDLIEIICTPFMEKVVLSQALFADVAPLTKHTYCQGFLKAINATEKLHGATESKLITIRLHLTPTRIYIVPKEGFGLAKFLHTSNPSLRTHVLEKLHKKGLHIDKASQLLRWHTGRVEPVFDECSLFKLAGMPTVPLYLRQHWHGQGTVPAEVLIE